MSSYNVQTISSEAPSICIPYVLDRVEKSTIHSTFNFLFGEQNIDRIDVVFREKPDGEKFKRVFVHMRSWPKSAEAQSIRKRLLQGDEVLIMYDDPWYWKCSASRVEKPGSRQPEEKKPFIFDPASNTRVTRFVTEQEPETRPRQRRMVLSEFIPRQVQQRQSQQPHHQPISISQTLASTVFQ